MISVHAIINHIPKTTKKSPNQICRSKTTKPVETSIRNAPEIGIKKSAANAPSRVNRSGQSMPRARDPFDNFEIGILIMALCMLIAFTLAPRTSALSEATRVLLPPPFPAVEGALLIGSIVPRTAMFWRATPAQTGVVVRPYWEQKREIKKQLSFHFASAIFVNRVGLHVNRAEKIKGGGNDRRNWF